MGELIKASSRCEPWHQFETREPAPVPACAVTISSFSTVSAEFISCMSIGNPPTSRPRPG